MASKIEKCPYCGLTYGGNGMRLNEPSINGRTKPNECMCGAVYKNGNWQKD